MSGTGGSGLMETLMSAAAGGAAAYGGGTGAQMRMARELQQGQGYADREAGGSLDNLNKALNMRAAMKATPEAPWAIRNMITSLGEPQLNDIVKGGPGNMPSYLTDNGVSYAQIKKYYDAKNATMFARFGGSSQFGTDAQRAEVAKYRAAGGLGYLKGASAKEQEKAINILTGAGVAGGTGSAVEISSTLRKQAAVLGVYDKVNGRGAGDTLASGTAIAKANEARGTLTGVNAETEASENGVFGSDADTLPQGTAAEKIARRKAQGGIGPGKEVSQSIATLVSALQQAVDFESAASAPRPSPLPAAVASARQALEVNHVTRR